MWIYTNDIDARLRLLLMPAEGFWLDHWLFLHADETDRLWSCRPIGIRTLGTLAMKARLPVDKALVLSVRRELAGYQRLKNFLPEPPPSEDPIDCGEGPWPITWQHWFELTQKPEFSSDLRGALVSALVEAIEKADLYSVAFLNRRLASELADIYPSDRSILQSALKFVLRDNSEHSFAERVYSLLIRSLETRSYNVEFKLAPTSISSQVANWRFSHDAKLVCEEATEYQRHSRTLTGMKLIVGAPNPERALFEAIELLREILQELRVRHYVRTNVYGAVAIDEISNNESEIESETSDANGAEQAHLALPQPFWTKKSGRRGVPYLPTVENLEIPVKHRWLAARWHVSQAVSVWPEDIHSAASEVWQALESFGGSAKNVMTDLVEEYIKAVPIDLLRYTANCLNLQVGKFKHIGISPDWYFWNRRKVDPLKWLGRVTHPDSYNHHSLWKNPPSTLFLFDNRVGLLTILGRHIHGIEQMAWLRDRVQNDIGHLYALRNRVVHRGEHIATDRWAAFLARLGLEMLLTVMNLRVERNS